MPTPSSERPQAPSLTIAQLQQRVGESLGYSTWMTLDQARIDRFAECTGDHQFIHVDPQRAARETPFGGTIAHGFLTLSLLPVLLAQKLPTPSDCQMGINYGLDGVRFIQPVRSGAEVRLGLTLLAVTEKRPGQWLLRLQVELQIKHEEKPAYLAELLLLYVN